MNTKSSQRSAAAMDWVGISLSVLCAIHCFGAPVILTAISALGMDAGGERFETIMVYVIIALASLAGITGWRKHRSRIPLLLFGAGALVFLALRPAVEHEWEPVLTIIGGILMISGHYRNWICNQPCDKHCVQPLQG